MLDLADQRQQMVRAQIARRGVRDPRVLEAMGRIPRERFVPEALAEFAYEDSPLPLDSGQTISQPYVVARMVEAARIAPGDRVLEVGTGSGYAAAVIAAIADHVYTIERHADLAEMARARLRALGCSNIDVRTGDGSLGWPEAAPFDAILAAAGGPAPPEPLKRQLKIGGRLVIPVGESPRDQRLVRLTRLTADSWREDELEAVVFVPLIGEHGWTEDERARGPGWTGTSKARTQPPETLPEAIAEAAEPLPDIDDEAFGRMFDRFAKARVVMLGEASHGTSEFYRARAAITRRLIEAHGFTIVAAEADWPDAASFDRYVKGRPQQREGAEPAFQRFPTWMWRNVEVQAFLDWLKDRNAGTPPERQAGFYGLDLYSLSASMRAVIDYLERVDPEAAQVARQRYGCLMPWGAAPQQYGKMALTAGYALCEESVVQMLRELNAKRLEYALQDGEQFLDAAANARLVKDAEAYYRAIYNGAADSWNVRDRHMFDTLRHLLDHGGPASKAVVWAHNSHIGDARHTDMGLVRDELNIGQLVRERFGEETALIGFGTHTGTVACADDWDEPMQIKRVNPSRPGSYERQAHDSGVPRFLLDLREGVHEAARHRLLEPRLERFIGVIYRPDTERWSHYVECQLPRQFDAWVWFDQTTAVTPLPARPGAGPGETWPFGL